MRRLKLPAIIVAVVIVIGVLLGGRTDTEEPRNDAFASPLEPVTTQHPDAGPTGQTQQPNDIEDIEEGQHGEDPEPIETPSHEGGEDPDYTHDEQVLTDAVAASSEFVQAWLTQAAPERIRRLEPVTVPALVDGLSDPMTRIWNTTPVGEPQIIETAGQALQLQQAFADGRAIDMLLLLEPNSRYGWVVSDVVPVMTS